MTEWLKRERRREAVSGFKDPSLTSADKAKKEADAGRCTNCAESPAYITSYPILINTTNCDLHCQVRTLLFLSFATDTRIWPLVYGHSGHKQWAGLFIITTLF